MQHSWSVGGKNGIMRPVGDIDERGKHPGKYPRCLAFSDRWTGGEMLQVRYARDAWLTSGLRVRIRLVVLSNLHVESIFIWATVYFLLILKDLNHFQDLFNYFNATLSRIVLADVSMTSSVNRGVDWVKLTRGSRMSLTILVN